MKSRYCSFQSIVSPYELQKPVDWEFQFGRGASLEVEIGFGLGEVLLRQAEQSPDRNFIGIEQHWERICKTLRTLKKRQSVDQCVLQNVRILKVDARVAFERLFAPKSIDYIYCLFPCPWPKEGHTKHRLFTHRFLRLLNSRLKTGGSLKIVTDFQPYFEWVLEQALKTGFIVETKNIRPQFDTKFEKKWRDEGLEHFYEIRFKKKDHLSIPVVEDTLLKSYVLENFDPQKINLEDLKGDVSVIFKETIFDQEKQKMLIHVLVAEDGLTQHFWASIAKKNKKWKVTKSDGQNFFATPGIAAALSIVYEAAKLTS